jgi:hypothetical protein
MRGGRVGSLSTTTKAAAASFMDALIRFWFIYVHSFKKKRGWARGVKPSSFSLPELRLENGIPIYG